jgi:hypothetical protein
MFVFAVDKPELIVPMLVLKRLIAFGVAANVSETSVKDDESWTCPLWEMDAFRLNLWGFPAESVKIR